MAKNALGKGLGALLGENPAAQEEVAVSTGSAGAGGLHNTTLKRTKLPPAIKMEEDGSMWLDPALLKPNPKQPRVEFNQRQLEELCESIKSNGILQPIIIEDAGDGSFYIIAGERRTRKRELTSTFVFTQPATLSPQ